MELHENVLIFTRMGILYIILLCIGGFVLLFIAFRYLSKFQDKYMGSSLENAEVYKNELVVMSHIYHSGGDTGDAFEHTRIVHIDILTGKYLQRTVMNTELKLEEKVDPLLVLRAANMYYVYDMSIRKKVFDYGILYAYDARANAEKLSKITYNNRNFSIVTLKGTQLSIPLEKLASINGHAKEDDQSTGNLFSFKKDENNEVYYLEYENSRTPALSTYIHPEKISELNNQVVFLFHDTLDEYSTIFLAKADTSGNLLWKLSNPDLGLKHRMEYDQKIELKYHYIYQYVLVMVFDAKRDITAGIDLNTGKIIWKHKV